MAALLQAHPERGVLGARLADVAGFDGADPGTQVKRELKHLERQGWQIENIAGPGESARYRMRTVDNRLRVRLTLEQQTALRRAVLLADRADLVERLGLPDSAAAPAEPAGQEPAAVPGATPEELALVVSAVRERRLLRFRYKSVPRVVHPESVRNQNGIWYLRGVEDAAGAGSAAPKVFVVARMSEAEVDAPGTADAVDNVRHTGLHPMTWEIDPPVDVVLEAAAEFAPDVRRWLGEPVATSEPAVGLVRLTYRVTHRGALRARLNELGRRVRIVGPPEVREEVVAHLAEAAALGGDATGEQVGR